MNEILRDAEHTSLRLVMTPDRMVVKEAMRTFTYLNLFGYLTDAVVVNRVFPEEVDGTYFGAWRAVQTEQLELVESGFAPVPVLRAPYFEREVLGARDARPPRRRSCSASVEPAAVLHASRLPAAHPRRRARAAAARAAVRVEGRRDAEEDRARARGARRRRQAHDPAARVDGGLPPAAAAFADGALVVTFEPVEEAVRVPDDDDVEDLRGHIDAAHAGGRQARARGARRAPRRPTRRSASGSATCPRAAGTCRDESQAARHDRAAGRRQPARGAARRDPRRAVPAARRGGARAAARRPRADRLVPGAVERLPAARAGRGGDDRVEEIPIS